MLVIFYFSSTFDIDFLELIDMIKLEKVITCKYIIIIYLIVFG